jgi:hypothetical protein
MKSFIIMADRLTEPVGPPGVITGFHGVSDHRRQGGAASPLEGIGDLRAVGTRMRAVEGDHGLGQPTVLAPPHHRRDGLIDHPAHHLMHEGEALLGFLPHEMALQEDPQMGRGVRQAHQLQPLEREGAADHRCDLQDLPGALRQTSHPLQDQGAQERARRRPFQVALQELPAEAPLHCADGPQQLRSE